MSLLCLLFLTAISLLAEGSAGYPPKEISLRLIRSEPLPWSNVSGVFKNDQGNALFWSETEQVAMIFSNTGRDIIDLGKMGHAPVRGISNWGGQVHAIRADGRIVELTAENQVTLRHTGLVNVFSAAPIPGEVGAFLVFSGTEDSVRMGILRGDTVVAVPMPRDGIDHRNTRITCHSSTCILSLLKSPFDAWELKGLSWAQVIFGGELSETLDDPLSWVTGPPVPLESDFIQVLSNIRDSTQRLLLYGPGGRLEKQATLGAPIAFLATDPVHRELIGFRRSDRMEAVWYRYSVTDGDL